MKQAESKLGIWDFLVILFGTAALMCLGLGYGWSVFRGRFRVLYPLWTEANLSLIFSFSMIFFGVGSFLCGLMLRRIRTGWAILTGAAVFCSGFLGVSLLNPESSPASLWGMYLFYGILGGGGIGICYNAINSSVPRFFPARKGTVSGILMAGYGSGALILGMLASRLIRDEQIGLFRTFRILAAAIGAVLVLCALVFQKRESLTDVSRSGGKSLAELKGFSPGRVLRLSSVWVLQLRNIFSYAACLMIIDQAGNLSEAFRMSAVAGLTVSVANGLIRIPSGILVDRIGSTKTLRIGNLVLVAASLLLWALQAVPGRVLFFLCFILFGVSYGMTPPVSVSINEEFFGAKHRSVNYAFFSFTLAPASLAGPTVLGVLRDRFGSSVTLTAAAVSVYAAIAFCLALMIRRPFQPWSEDAEKKKTA